MASFPRLILAAATCLLVLSACRQPAKPLAAMAPVAAPEGRILVAAAHTDTGQPDAARTIRSVLDVPERMTFGDFAWDERGVASGPVWIRVDLGRQLISVFRGADEIGSAVILFGGNGKPTPTGDFIILQKAADYHSRTYDAPMPFMLRLTKDGVAIHASNVREGWATHGCIGVPLEFARRLFAVVKVGDPVSITLVPDNQAADPAA
jgi:hypothetical protein